MKKIKFIHISDSHIGLNRFTKTTSRGHNSRGEDFLNSFRSAINEIIKLNPDFILHAGDMFDSVVIADRYIYEVQEILKNIKCPFIITGGNHTTPKTLSAINPILLLNVLPNVTIVNEGYEKITINVKGSSASIHAVPHIIDVDRFTESLKNIELDKEADFNIAVTHGGLKFGNYKYVEEGHMIPEEFINQKFDYIALGDYHLAKKIHERCYYSGGNDIFKSSEVSKKCYLEVSLDGEDIDVKKHDISVRRCHNAELSCPEKGLEEIYSILENYIKKMGNTLDDSVVYLKLIDIESSVREALDKVYIKNLFKHCFHVQIKISTLDKDSGDYIGENEVIGDIVQEWLSYSSEDKEQMNLGEQYLNEVMEECK